MSHRADEPSIGTLFTRLVDNARDAAKAEVIVVKARISERLAAYKAAIVFFAFAGVLAVIAIIVALVGAVLSLATIIGPGLATLAVVGAVMVVAAILAFVGKARLARPSIGRTP